MCHFFVLTTFDVICDLLGTFSTESFHSDGDVGGRKRLGQGRRCSRQNINLLLTELEGRTGEYWPEVVTVRTEHSEVRTKTTEGQYSPVRPEQARLVSSLLYGTLFLIVKWTSRGLHLKNVRLLHPSLKFQSFQISIFLASAGSFNVKNYNFHTFFSLSWLQILNLPALLQNKNTRIGPFPWKRSVLQNPDRERTNQSTRICLGLGLPYNKNL